VPVFDNIDSLQQYMQTHKAVIISRKEYSNDMDSVGLQALEAHHDLFENHTTVIYTNGK